MPKSQLVNNRVITLHKQGIGPTKISRILAEEGLRCTRQTAAVIIKKYKKDGVVTYKPLGNGGIHKITVEMKQIIDEAMYRNDELSAAELVAELETRTGVTLSERAVRYARANLAWVKSGNGFCQLVSVVNQQKRFEWCHELLATDEDFQNVIFTDESSIWIDRHARVCFRKKWDLPRLKPKVKHPYKVHVWAGISMRGATGICIFTGNMDSAFYIETILDDYLLPFIQRTYPDGHRFMQDNDPKHTAARTKEHMLEKDIRWWPTPPSSPDLNPIEMVWASLKHHLRKHVKPKNKEELIAGIGKFWEGVSPEMCRKYIGHIHKVIPVVVSREGKASGH